MEWSWADGNAHPGPERSARRVRGLRVRHVDAEPGGRVVQATVERKLDALELRLGGSIEVEVAGFLPGEGVEIGQARRNDNGIKGIGVDEGAPFRRGQKVLERLLVLFEAGKEDVGPNRLELERGRGPSHARAVRERLEQRPGGIRGGRHDCFVAEVDKLPVELLFLKVQLWERG